MPFGRCVVGLVLFFELVGQEEGGSMCAYKKAPSKGLSVMEKKIPQNKKVNFIIGTTPTPIFNDVSMLIYKAN